MLGDGWGGADPLGGGAPRSSPRSAARDFPRRADRGGQLHDPTDLSDPPESPLAQFASVAEGGEVSPAGSRILLPGSPSAAGGGGVGKSAEDYARDLEVQLATKSQLISQLVQVHKHLEVRIMKLDEGLTVRDAQLAEMTRQCEEARGVCDQWSAHAGRLEEEVQVLQRALVERSDEGTRRSAAELLHLRGGGSSGSDGHSSMPTGLSGSAPGTPRGRHRAA